jgi:hypothetical protein
MYLAVAAVIAGQALVLGRWVLVGYGLVFGLAAWSFVDWYEEPTLSSPVRLGVRRLPCDGSGLVFVLAHGAADSSTASLDLKPYRGELQFHCYRIVGSVSGVDTECSRG